MVASGQSSANRKCGDTYKYQFPVGEGRSFFCHPVLKGRYVIVRLVDKGKPLTLCEVEVYSEKRGMMHVHLHKLGCPSLRSTVDVFGAVCVDICDL